jgi:hypothetical protein
VLDFDNSKAIVVLVFISVSCIHSHSVPFLRCSYSYNYNSQFTSPRRIAAESNRKPRWRFGQVNSTSSWYTRSLSRVEKSHTSFVLSVSCCGKWTLFINFDKLVWKPGEFFSNRVRSSRYWTCSLNYQGPGYIVIISKEEKQSSSDCINNWTWVSLTRNSSSKDSSAPPAYWDSIGLVDETCSRRLLKVSIRGGVGQKYSRTSLLSWRSTFKSDY